MIQDVQVKIDCTGKNTFIILLTKCSPNHLNQSVCVLVLEIFFALHVFNWCAPQNSDDKNQLNVSAVMTKCKDYHFL